MAYRNYGYHPEQAKPFPVPVVGVWRRFFAYTIDYTIMFFISALLIGIGLFLVYQENPRISFDQFIYQFSTTEWVLIGAGRLIEIIYFVGCWTLGGQTLGKWLLGIKVVAGDGRFPSFAAACLRYLGYLFNNIVYSLGFLAIAFDKRKQGWHDKMGNTFVIPSTVEVPPGAEPVFIYPHDSNVADKMAVVAYIFCSCVLPFLLVFGFLALFPDVSPILENMPDGLR